MTYRAPTPPPKEREPERPRGVVVRMADPPEDEERAVARERAALVREEGRRLAEDYDRERVRFDRIVRVAGGLSLLIGIAFLGMEPLRLRAAATAGMALTCGPLALLLGGQGGTRADTMPLWLKGIYATAMLVGGALGVAWLT